MRVGGFGGSKGPGDIEGRGERAIVEYTMTEGRGGGGGCHGAGCEGGGGCQGGFVGSPGRRGMGIS
jgi:hypothetical protein